MLGVCLHFGSLLLWSCHGCSPVVLHLEQHFWLHAPYSVLEILCNQCFLYWNMLWGTWACNLHEFCFVQLIPLNQACWLAEVSSGHLLLSHPLQTWRLSQAPTVMIRLAVSRLLFMPCVWIRSCCGCPPRLNPTDIYQGICSCPGSG